MISWLQTRFQKHYQVLFVVLLAVIIVAFVFTFGASGGIGQADRTGPRREVFGNPMTTEQDQSDFIEVAQISAYLQTGSQSITSAELQDYAFQRAATISIADSLGLPHPTDEQLADYIRTLRAFSGPDGAYDPESYGRFLDNIAANPLLSESIISYVLKDDFRSREANRLIGGPGYVLDTEVRVMLNRLNSVWSVTEGTLKLADFNPTINPADEALEAFYEENAFRYEIPERMHVGYVTFNAADFVDSAPMSDTAIESYFEKNRARYQRLHDARPEKPEDDTSEVQLADVRDAVENDLGLETAMNVAVRTASDFAYSLFENSVEPESETLASMIAGAGLTLQNAPAFAQREIPEGLTWNLQIVDEAFKLTPDHWFTDPLTVGSSVILVFYRDRLTPYTPEFQTVRARVVADFTSDRKRELFTERGEALRLQLQDEINSERPFSEAAADAGLETKEWTEFTFQSPPEDFNYSLLSRLDQIPVGTVSDMVLTGDLGSFVFVGSRSEPVDGVDDVALETTRKQIADLNSNLSRSLILNDMIHEELIRADFVSTR